MGERYEIREKIGQGGRGQVYRALDTRLNREVAIKRITVEPGSTPEQIEKVRQALMKEATAMSALNHPNIVSVYDIQQDSEGGFVVMELLNGETLHDVVKRNVLTLQDFHAVAQQSLEALISAAECNMLHRDLKPGNVMIVWLPSNKFQLKILDFGLAKISAQPSLQTVQHGRSIVGTIYFMAPEQFELRELSQATDLYAMGCVYYFCLTGRYPFNGDSVARVMEAHLNGTYEPLDHLRPDLPPHLCQWVMWLMNRDLRHRPQTAQEALDRLPLATGNEGEVFVIQALEAEDPFPIATATGDAPVVRPAHLVAEAHRHGKPLPVPPPHRAPASATTAVAAPRLPGQTPSSPFHPALLLAIALALLAAGIGLAVRVRTAADDPIRWVESFDARAVGPLHASSPPSPPLPLRGRHWSATPGLKFTGKELQADGGRQLATFDITGTFAPTDTIRIVISGLKNPTPGWFGVGLTDRDAPGVIDDDLAGWVHVPGDKAGTPGSGNLHEQGFRKKNIGPAKTFWKSGGGNDLELVLNCKDGQAAFFVNGVRAAIASLKPGGFPHPPNRLALVFANIPGTKLRAIRFENLGPCALQDVGPSVRASRSHLESIQPPAPPAP
jgi:serine/threonine protein kinase